jgi:uncharacterized repeat protein (TIGR03943 family)
MRLAAPLVAFGYGAYLLYTFRSGALYFYIHPIYMWPVVATGLVLIILAGAGARAGTHGHEPAHTPRAPDARVASGPERRSPLVLALLALPLVLGFGLTPQPLSVLSASQRGVDLTPAAGPEVPSEFLLHGRPETYTIKDWVKALQVDPEPGRHAGKPVRVTGFVHRDDRLPREWFLVARFVVKCCAVDAQPVGLPVRGAGQPPEPGRWVSVEGAWEVAEVGGERRPVIGATALVPVNRPEQPYLY